MSDHPASSGDRKKIRPEIQGLRAVAVATVALFHIWPAAMSGGYVGVDVFFVISGFLITGILVREGERTGRIDLLAFYARRARRLLPAATLVLVLVAALAPFFLPASQRLDAAIDVLAGLFYVENWRLAAQAVDYLARENAPSPVQHYWSLSVEEQFYILWPTLIITGQALARATGASVRATLRAMFGVVFVGSLAASIWLTATDPDPAYFVTHTRVWELSLGGLLALGAPALGDGVRRVLGAAGLASILAATFLYSTSTAFPGYAALLPALGAALVIVSGESRARLSIFSLLKMRPLQFLGDISYSVYLWHWPLILFVQAETGQPIGPVAGIVVLTATVGLAALTKAHVEDRFRYPQPGQPVLRRAALFASWVVAPLLASSVAFGMVAHDAAKLVADAGDYPGALAISHGAPVPEVEAPIPPLSLVRRDRPEPYDRGCSLGFAGVEPVGCRFGDPTGSYKVFLIGDSHAFHWYPAVEVVAQERGWDAALHVKSSCPLMLEMLRRAGEPYVECRAWAARVMEIIASEKPDLIIFGQMYNFRFHRSSDAEELPSRTDALVELWREIEAMGVQIAVIADTPRWNEEPDECFARDPGCSVPYDSIAREDPFVEAHERYPSVALINFNDVVCPQGVCSEVVGNVIVWKDRHHFTATYARTMARAFGERLDAALRQASRGREGS